MQHAGRFRNLFRRAAAPDALERLAVDRLQPDLEPIESGVLQHARVLRCQTFGADLGEEGQRLFRILALERFQQRLEPGAVVEGGIEKDDLARALRTQRRDQRSAVRDVQRPQHA